MVDSDRAYSHQEFLEKHPLLQDPDMASRFPNLVDAARVCESSLKCRNCPLAVAGIVSVDQYLEGLREDVPEAIEHYRGIFRCIVTETH